MSAVLKPKPDSSYRFQFSALTDVGIKRDHNEDYLLAKPEIGLFIVCDGMGGHAAGEVASELAANCIFEHISEELSIIETFEKNPVLSNRDEVNSLLEEAIGYANFKVREAAMEDSAKQGMGTTVALTLITSHGAFVAHVGDSRVYLHRNDDVHQVTDDHSFVNALVKKGMLNKEQAENHPHANVITQAVGVQQFVEPDVIFLDIDLGDRFIICSDGLSGYTSDDQLQYFSGSSDVEALPKKLIDHANKKGGKDNITAIIIHMGTDDTPPAHPEDITANKKIEVLQKVPLFHNLDFNQLSKLLQVIKVKKFKDGDIVVKEGNDGDDMYILLTGDAKVYVGAQPVAFLQAGGHFGEMALIDKSPRSATVKTCSDSKMLTLKREELFDLLKRYPDLGMKLFWSLLKKMNKRLRETDALIHDMADPNKEVELNMDTTREIDLKLLV